MKKMNGICLGLVLAIVLSGCAAAKSSPMEDSMSLAVPTTAGTAAPNYNQGPAAMAPDSGHYSDSELAEHSGYEIATDEEYLEITENKDISTADSSMLTFSLKVDTASYNNIVRYIESGNLPPTDAVRIEEMINYFNYDEVLRQNETPFSIYTEIGPSPLNANKNIAFVRVKSKDIDKEELPQSNLTFLIDSSGSMNSPDKLPLLKSAFSLLVETLTEDDTVSIVTYAGSASVIIDSVRGDQKEKIINAIYSLDAGGSTGGAEGILTAYKLAEKNFVEGGNNRVILATDGDFNVGVSSVGELEKLISKKRSSGVYLSVLGFGTENLKDNKMETLAKNGNGNYSYIDSVSSAKKVLVDELSSNLFTIADDVKAQVEFNPDLVRSYRLIGYENRQLKNKDFEDDKKDAGEIGIGTDVVLMFEFELTNGQKKQGLKYQEEDTAVVEGTNKYTNELFEVRIRYKDPGESESKLITVPVKVDRILGRNTSDFNFATSVAGFGHLLRNSEYTGDLTFEDVLALAKDNIGEDNGGYRKEFIDVLRNARVLLK